MDERDQSQSNLTTTHHDRDFMNPRGYDLSPLTGGQMGQVAQTLQENINVPIEAYG